MPHRPRLPALSVLLLLAPAVGAGVLRYEGLASDPVSGLPLYRETHYLRDSGAGPQQRLVVYRCIDSERYFARKQVHYRRDAEQPDFELEDARQGYREGLREQADTHREAFVRSSHAEPEQSARLPPAASFVADAGFDEFVKRHWQQLESGEEVRFRFLVPADLDILGLKIRRHRSESVDGRPASVIRLSLSAWWGFIAPHIDAYYDRETRVLLRYQGLSNLRGANGRNFPVRIEFPTGLRQLSDDSSLRLAAEMPLSDSCTRG